MERRYGKTFETMIERLELAVLVTIFCASIFALTPMV